MSSSPEQSDAAGNLPHNTSTTSVISALSVSGGESPPGASHSPASALLMTRHLGHLSAASSTPNSPHLSSRPSSGKHSRGKSVKKFLHGWKQVPTPTHSQPPTVPEDPLETNDHTNKARATRKLRKGWPQPIKFGRNFRRIRRRAGDKQYHSDDGYTSDPGIIREEDDDDETDENTETTDGADVRRTNMIRDIQGKLEKQRRLLHDEEEAVGGVNYQDYTTGELLQMDSDKQGFRRLKLHRGSKADQYKKKIAKLETDLRVLQEGGPLEARYGGYGGGLRGKIEGSIRGMSLSGLKGKLSNAGNRLMLKRRVPTSAAPDDDVLDVDDDEDDAFPEEDSEIPHGSVEVLAAPNEAELMKEQLVSVQESSEEFLQENQKLREEINQQTETLVRLEETMNLVIEKLEQERERAERLENQINDITELHQHEVGELRANLAQMESMTMGKSQDLEEAMETCQTKMDKLDAHVHHLIDSGERPARNLVRRPMADLLTFVLVSFAFLLKVVSILRTKLGLGVAVFILLLALLLYYLFYYQ